MKAYPKNFDICQSNHTGVPGPKKICILIFSVFQKKA